MLQESDCLEHVVSASEVQFFVFVWDRLGSAAEVLGAVAVVDYDFGPCVKERVGLGVGGEDACLVEVPGRVQVLARAQLAVTPLITGLQGTGEILLPTEATPLKIDNKVILIFPIPIINIQPMWRPI